MRGGAQSVLGRAMLVCLLAGPGTAAVGGDIKGKHLELLDPAKARQLRDQAARRHVADYPDGGFIADIDGRHFGIALRAGRTVTINGRGFATRARASNVALFDGPATTGMLLSIVSWSDTRVVVVVPTDPARLIPATNNGRMILQGVKAGGVWSRYEVTAIRFSRGS